MSTQRYILVEFGAPDVVDSLPDTHRMNRLAIIGRTWDHVHAFDSGSRYRLVIVDPPEYGIFSRILAFSVYNPWVTVESEWLRCGEYSKSDLIALVEHGLEHDDDVIQQWFPADNIITLLSSARSWSETLLAVEAIGGSHEVDPEVQEYVERVLGREA